MLSLDGRGTAGLHAGGFCSGSPPLTHTPMHAAPRPPSAAPSHAARAVRTRIQMLTQREAASTASAAPALHTTSPPRPCLKGLPLGGDHTLESRVTLHSVGTWHSK